MLPKQAGAKDLNAYFLRQYTDPTWGVCSTIYPVVVAEKYSLLQHSNIQIFVSLYFTCICCKVYCFCSLLQVQIELLNRIRNTLNTSGKNTLSVWQSSFSSPWWRFTSQTDSTCFFHYLLSTMLMWGWLKSLSPQNIFGVSGIKCAAAKFNTVERTA